MGLDSGVYNLSVQPNSRGARMLEDIRDYYLLFRYRNPLFVIQDLLEEQMENVRRLDSCSEEWFLRTVPPSWSVWHGRAKISHYSSPWEQHRFWNEFLGPDVDDSLPF